jgi:hypothetical protein
MKTTDKPNSVKPMTGAMLRALCAETGVVRSGKEPSRAAYEDLAQTINDFRRLVSLSTGRWRESSGRTRRLASGLRTLNDVLPAIRDDCSEALKAAQRSRSEVMLRLCQEDLVALDALIAAVAATRVRHSLLLPISQLAPPIERWHHFAEDLADAFRGAMHSTNPGLELRLSNNGPVVRFLKALVPEITGEEPTLNSVARYLQRSEQKGHRR